MSCSLLRGLIPRTNLAIFTNKPNPTRLRTTKYAHIGECAVFFVLLASTRSNPTHNRRDASQNKNSSARHVRFGTLPSWGFVFIRLACFLVVHMLKHIMHTHPKHNKRYPKNIVFNRQTSTKHFYLINLVKLLYYEAKKSNIIAFKTRKLDEIRQKACEIATRVYLCK